MSCSLIIFCLGSVFRHGSSFPEVKESDSNGHFPIRPTYPSISGFVYIFQCLKFDGPSTCLDSLSSDIDVIIFL